MKEVMNIGGRLALICAVAAVILGIVNSFTAPRILEYKEQQLLEALQEVVPSGEIGEMISIEDSEIVASYYPVTDSLDKITGWVLNLIGAGYAGDLKILAGYNSDGSVVAVVMMENQETPGLGKEAEKSDYMERFIGTGSGNPIPVRKNQLSQSDADSISGATITFSGVARALESGSDFVKTLETTND